MAGKVRALIDELLMLRTAGAPGLTHFVKVNLLLNGIDPDVHTATSEDNPVKVAALERMIREFKTTRR
jgi:hypothetical protein